MLRAASFLLLALLAVPTPAAAQPPPERPSADPARPVQSLGEHTPPWLKVGAAYRFRSESRSGNGFRENAAESYGLSRLLVDVSVEPRSWLRVHFQGQDARAPGKRDATPVFRDPFDVRQAWVRVGDPKRHLAYATVGCQELSYGKQRLVGPLDWTNTARQFDAARLTVGREDLAVDVFAGAVVRLDDKGFNRPTPGADFHGVHAKLNRWVRRGDLDAYTFWKTEPRAASERGGVGRADIVTSGFRVARPLAHGFDVEAEMAMQRGDIAGDDLSAWGGYWIAGYRPAGVRWNPRLSVEYQYGSGDGAPGDGAVGTFDQLFPTGHLYQGVADRVGWRNIQDVRAGLQLSPSQSVSLTLDYFSFWLASRQDHLYGVDGRIVARAPVGGAEHSYVGSEVDAVVGWKLRPHVTTGGGVGLFLPGSFLREVTPGRRHIFGYVFVNYVL